MVNEGPTHRKGPADSEPLRRVRNAVILPDGTKSEPMGSGVITGLLGVGGMANVYEIWNSQLEVNRAVKLLHPNYTEEAKQRFQTEIKITAKLHHANIIEIHAVGQWNGLPYIEMERISGFTLEKIIADRGALPIEAGTSIALMIGRALRYAHNQEYVIYGQTYHGVIHRDLKPSNIMVATNGAVKLMDFGIARPTDASIHTTDGSILGTMQYLSPEQLDGKEADIRTDIYSLGTILYEMLTGIKAFPEQNVSKLMLSKIKNDFTPLEGFDVRIPPKLRKLIHRCMVHDRDKRVANSAEFLTELSKVHRSLTPLSPEQVMRQFMNVPGSERTVVTTRRRVPLKAMAAAAGVVAAVYGTTVVVSRLARRPDTHVAPVVDRTPVQVPVPTPAPPQPHNAVAPPAAEPPARPSSAAPAKEAARAKTAREPELTLIDKLKQQHGTADLAVIFQKEIEARRFAQALEVYARLSPADAQSDKVALFRLRALRELGRGKELGKALMAGDVADGEFYLQKAKMFFERNEIAETMKYLKLCQKTPSAFMQSSGVRLERLYYTARCRGLEFDATPTRAAQRAALESWYEVKAELQTSKDHAYFREAEKEMQRITQRATNEKG